jgi:hypothetical protein
MAKLKATPKNFEQAQRVLGTKSSVRLGNNTYLERVQEPYNSPLQMIVVRLHNTYIVQFHSDGRVTLHTGGWHTVTTKDRINEFITGRVYQRNHEWFYVGHNLEGAIDWDHPEDFTDGINVRHEGKDVS